MANRNYPSQRIYNMHMMAVQLDAAVSIGASGAPTIVQALGINSITRLSAGVYRIQLQDNYVKILGLDSMFQSPLAGSPVTAGSFSVGTVYRIVSLGTTNWVTAGLPSGITPAVGAVFKAAAIGSGTGTAQIMGNSGISSVELLDASANMLSNQPFVQPAGGFVDIQCLGATDASTTTLIPADPANGSVMYLKVLLSNSSVQ